MKWRLYFDGGCMPVNPGGVATYGWVLFDPEGERRCDGYGVIKEGEGATNNVAEFEALERGMIRCAELGLTNVEFLGDSQLVVNVMNKKWKCRKPHLKEIHVRVLSVMKRVPKCTFSWVRRELNEEADILAERAYEQHTGKRAQLIIAHSRGSLPTAR